MIVLWIFLGIILIGVGLALCTFLFLITIALAFKFADLLGLDTDEPNKEAKKQIKKGTKCVKKGRNK